MAVQGVAPLWTSMNRQTGRLVDHQDKTVAIEHAGLHLLGRHVGCLSCQPLWRPLSPLRA